MSRRPGVTRIALTVLIGILVLASGGCTWLLYPEYESVPRSLLHEAFMSDRLDEKEWDRTPGPEQPPPEISGGRLYVFGSDNTITTTRNLGGAFIIRVDWAVVSDTVNGVNPMDTPDFRVRLERPEVSVELVVVNDIGI
ncbi:MAG: hypothetical protein E4H09_01095, partial [Spirochaetales bacterium]